jgi:hypothetical protein
LKTLFSNASKIKPGTTIVEVDNVNSPEKSRIKFNDINALKRRYSNDSCDESKTNIKFSTPAYIQRYMAVLNVLIKPEYKGTLKKV